MGIAYNPRTITDGLVLCLDAGNVKSYDKYENLAYNSEDLNLWTNNTSNLPSITVTPNSATAPNGTLTADVLAQSAATGASRWVASLIDYTYVSGVTYTLSVWLKKVSGTDAQPAISLWVNDFTQQSVGTLTTEWVRYSATFTASSTSNVNTFTGLNVGWDGNGAASNFTFAAWGFQLEIGSTATDYYPTTSTSKIRGTTWGDLSGNGNNGTLVNGVGYSNGALSFDGVDDYVTLGTPSLMNGVQVPLTICVWAKANALGSYNVLWGVDKSTTGGGLYSMLRVDSGQIKYFTTNSSGGIQANGNVFSVSTGVWNFYAVTVSGTISSPSVTIYLNNSSSTLSYSTLSSSPDLTVDFRIGSNQRAGEDWNGNISNVMWYNRALTAAEIQQNYNALKERYNLKYYVTPIETTGSVYLYESYYYYVSTDGGNTYVSPMRNGEAIKDSGDWKVVAAEPVNGVNQLLWKNAVTNQVVVWTFNGSWEYVSTGTTLTIGAATTQLEVDFNYDIDGDNQIG